MNFWVLVIGVGSGYFLREGSGVILMLLGLFEECAMELCILYFFKKKLSFFFKELVTFWEVGSSVWVVGIFLKREKNLRYGTGLYLRVFAMRLWQSTAFFFAYLRVSLVGLGSGYFLKGRRRYWTGSYCSVCAKRLISRSFFLKNRLD